MNAQGILDFFDYSTTFNCKSVHDISVYKCLNIVVRTISRRNRPRLFHALVEIRRARRTPGVRLFDSPVT